MLKLKVQYFGHLMLRANSFEKTLMLGKIEGRRRRGWQKIRFGWHHQLNGHGFGWILGVGDGQGGLACCDSWGHKELDTTEQLNWIELRRWLIWLTLPGSSQLITPLTKNFQSALECPTFKYECISKPGILGEILNYKILGTKPIHRGK